MADLKISQLTALATFADDDLLAIVDTSATETKKVEWGAMKTALASVFWKLDGNTVGSEKFIGTIDNFAFPVRVNNTEVWSWETNGDIQRKGLLFSIDYSGVDFNTSWGQDALASVSASSGASNSAVGANALSLVTTGSFMTAVGVDSGASVVSGSGGSYYGWRAGAQSTGSNATFIGNRAGSNGAGSAGITSGDNVTAVGALAGLKNADGAISSSSYFGFSTVAEASSEVVIGGLTNNNFYFGVGKFGSAADRTAIIMQPSSVPSGSNYYANETDGNGVNWTFAVSRATGSGTSGDMIWQYAPSGSTGTTLTTLTTGMTFKGTTGQLQLGSTLAAVTQSMFKLQNISAAIDFYASNATPESAITANTGDICYVDTGSAGQVFVKATGTATNTGWLQLTTGSSGAYLLASGATTGATSQAQVFTSGIKAGVIDDNATGEIAFTISTVQKAAINTTGIGLIDGSAASPSYYFSSDSSTGFYLKAGNSELGTSVNGALVGGFNTTGLFAGLAGTLTGTLKFNGATSGTVTVQSAAAAGTWTLTLPTTDGNSGEFLQTNGSGVTTWAVPAGTGANTALSNLAAVAINTTLLPGSNDGAALGSGTLSFSDLFLASGGLINFANGNSVITHSSAVLTVSTGDLRVTTAGTNATSVATLDGTQTLTNKSIVATQLTGTAYTMAVNNTSGTAAYTLTNYRNDVIADYDGTFTWNSTPPSTIVSQKYVMSRIGNMVILTISVLYTSTGTTNTTCIVTFPSTAPAPAVLAASGDAASEYMYPITGARVEANQTANPSAIRGGIRRNSGNSAFEILLIFGSTSALQLQVTVIYFTA